MLVPLSDEALTPEATPEFQMLAIQDQEAYLLPLGDCDVCTPPAGDGLTEQAKAYLESQSPRDKSGFIRCPSTSQLAEIIQAGQDAGELAMGVEHSKIEAYLISVGKRLMGDAEKAYILQQLPKLTDGSIVVPSRSTIQAMVAEGVAAGVLHESVTVEGARSFVRKCVRDQKSKKED